MEGKKRHLTYEDCLRGIEGLSPEEQLSLIETISSQNMQVFGTLLNASVCEDILHANPGPQCGADQGGRDAS